MGPLQRTYVQCEYIGRANMNRRSGCDCRIWLVVRYVNDGLAIRCIRHEISYVDSHSHSEGYHVPAVRHRDAFYQKLEDDRAAALGQK